MKTNMFFKESDGMRLEAHIHKSDEGYSIKYYINGAETASEDFKGKSIHFVEDAAQNWLEGVKKLNG